MIPCKENSMDGASEKEWVHYPERTPDGRKIGWDGFSKLAM